MGLIKKKTAQSAPETQPAVKPNDAAKKRLRKRILLGLGAAAAAAVVGLVVWGGPMAVQTETVTVGSFDDTFTETGYVKSGLARDHLSPVSGKVAEVPVKRNSAVKAGDVLVRIQATELEYELQSHQNALDGYRAQVEETIASLRAEISSLAAERSRNNYDNATELSPEAYVESLRSQAEVAQAQAKLAEQELNNKRSLYEVGAESRIAVEEAEKAYREAQGQSEEATRKYDESRRRLSGSGNSAYYGTLNQSYSARIQAAQEKLNDYLALSAAAGPEAEAYEKLSIGKQIAEEEAQVLRLREKLERCTVRALCDGYVSALPAENLSDVTEGALLATVRERADFTLEVNVLTNEEPFLRVGDDVTLTQKLKGQQTAYAGVISEIGSYAEKSLSATGAEEYRVRVVVDIPESEGLKDGYELEARFTTYHSDAALTVPNSALFKDGGQDCVFVVSGMSAETRPVTVVHKASIRTEISSGLSAGEQIILDANQEGLENGTPVISSNN